MSRNLNEGRARDGKAKEPLRFGPEREPQGDTPKGGRPDWKKASTRKVRETTAPAEPERRGDGQPPPEQAAPVLQDDPFQPTPNPTPEPEQEEPDAAPHEVESPRGPDRPDPHGGPASRLRFDKESDTVKPEPDKAAAPKGPVRSVLGTAGWGVHGYVHGKIYENEHENVGIEGAHRSELAAETAGRKGVRFVKRKVRQHPAKAAQRAQSKFTKATANYQFRMAAQEHPELRKNAVSRFFYKQRLKRQYRKQAKEAAKQGVKAAKKTAVTTEKLAARTVGFVKRHPAGVLLVLSCLLVVVLFQSCTSALAPLGGGTGGGIGATTYPATDEAILGAESAYAGMEAELQDYLDNYTTTHGYDEYHFDLDEIEHDPYVLISILSALHEGEWTLADVEGTLESLFDRQYILTETVVTETKYDENDEPYTWYICYVTLENFNLSHLPVYMMGEDQLTRYALYMATLGNRPDLFPSSGYVGKYTEPVERYEVPAEYLSDEQFAALLTEAEKYVGYPYVWGGSSPATSFDCSGYLSWVLNQCGWNVGRLGAQGLYNYCTPTSNPQPGDLVFFVGTYDTPGVSHCGLYLGDGMMLHCGDPIGYANLNSSYWQAHLYAYGRLP